MSNTAKPAQMIKKMFGRFFDATAQIQKKKPAPKPTQDTGAGPKQAFEASLKKLSKQKELVVAGNLHVLNTAKIKEKVGEKWPRVQTMIKANVERIIMDHLGPGDKMFNYSELNYVVAFENLNEQAAAKKLAHISKQIIQRIFGSEAVFQGFELETSAAGIKPKDVVESGGDLDTVLGKIDELGTSVRHSMDSIDQTDEVETIKKPQAAPSNTDIIAQISELLDNIYSTVGSLDDASDMASLHCVLNNLQDQLNSAFFQSQGFIDQLENSGLLSPDQQEMQSFLKDLQQLSAQLNEGLGSLQKDLLNEAEADAPDSDSTELEDKLANANVIEIDPDEANLGEENQELLTDFGKGACFRYFPFWDVKLSVVNTYKCAITLKSGKNVKELDSSLPSNCPASITERINLITLQKILIDIKEAAAEQNFCAYTVTLWHSVLQNPKCRAMLNNMLQTLSATERKLLIIEIAGIADNTWASRILETVGYLKPYCRAILVRLPRQFEGFSELKAGGVYAVGYHLEFLPGTQAQNFQSLEQLVINAERCGLATFVGGVDHISLAASAVGSGVRYISGTAIGLALEIPWGILPFTLASVYTRELSISE